MAFDPPAPGQVIDYRYLWFSEYRKGLEEGRKDRPCAVVYAVETKNGKSRVYVLPISHTRPTESENGIEVLPQWKRHLRLDDRAQWIITTELNHFEWPGPDLPGSSTEAISRGFLPEKVTTRLRDMIRARVKEKSLAAVSRDFDLQKAQDDLRRPKSKGEDRER
jgi:hypothetical protein